ncbi:phage holin family protein [Leptolyngbyaceae cyanobacterium CCMR0082]|uniref:Phage holin family protein n=2 Tax=Adonisia turfae TaxID=2950184 RepID=A0A6M0SDE2_9CYAN|nr:phage holin family protein [Adonisia turfae]EKV00866.1 putative membrane protein [Leptolyngbya sp. PCC 7375]MDV3352842.1 phage holin family protein [Leptothoe sp. LEGE 181152]NEZ55904.1 phage holin family protein [Adonisia turfae CCMR0081]NEZ65991.1 phage holin family protein [Adonisia turfae CCMR0082]
MDVLVPFIVTWLITTIALVIITFLPTGVESDSFGKTAITALVFGVLNGVVNIVAGLPVLGGVLWLVTLGGLLLNLILFGLSAKLVEGFRLRWGIWSAIIGAFLLSVITSILNAVI